MSWRSLVLTRLQTTVDMRATINIRPENSQGSVLGMIWKLLQHYYEVVVGGVCWCHCVLVAVAVVAMAMAMAVGVGVSQLIDMLIAATVSIASHIALAICGLPLSVNLCGSFVGTSCLWLHMPQRTYNVVENLR